MAPILIVYKNPGLLLIKIMPVITVPICSGIQFMNIFILYKAQRSTCFSTPSPPAKAFKCFIFLLFPAKLAAICSSQSGRARIIRSICSLGSSRLPDNIQLSKLPILYLPTSAGGGYKGEKEDMLCFFCLNHWILTYLCNRGKLRSQPFRLKSLCCSDHSPIYFQDFLGSFFP